MKVCEIRKRVIHEISGADFFGNEKSKFHKSERRSRSARSSQAKFAHSWSAARICEITISWELMALGAQRLPWKHDVTPSAATVGYLRPEEGFRSFDSAKNRLHRGSFIRFFLADTAALPTTVVHLLTPLDAERGDLFVVRLLLAPARISTNAPAIVWTPIGTSANYRGNVYVVIPPPSFIARAKISPRPRSTGTAYASTPRRRSRRTARSSPASRRARTCRSRTRGRAT